MRLGVIVFWTTWALASAKPYDVNAKKRFLNDLLEWASGDDDAIDSTFDSTEFCAKKFRLKRRSDERPAANYKVTDEKIEKLKDIMSTVGAIGKMFGTMQCIQLVDAVLLPKNVVKQSVSDIKRVKKEGGSRRSQLSAILRPIVSTPLKTFFRMFEVIIYNIDF